MELLFVTVIGAIIGLAARYLLPRREAHGAALVPAIGAAAASAVWAALTWAGLAFNGGWIWWITLLGTAAIVTIVTIVVGRERQRGDAAMMARLSKA